jgi:glycosyltransferase involved in cell wall biosynthesis
VNVGRVLVIAYNFPPHGAVGTLRTLRLVQELARRNWEVTVLAGAPATYLDGDPLEPGLLAAVPKSVRVVQQRAVRPVTTAQRWIRRLVPRRAADPAAGKTADPTTGVATTANGGRAQAGGRASLSRRAVNALDVLTSIPDAEAGWVLPAFARALSIAVRRRPGVIYSTAPPWSTQVAAYLVAEATGCRWVSDFRDPWSRAPWRTGQPFAVRRASAGLERRVVGRADAVVFNTRTARDEFGAAYGADALSKLHVVPNGCDADDFAGIEPTRPDAFVLLHAGTLYGGRDPRPMFDAVASAIGTGRIDRRRFTLRFVGVPASVARELGAIVAALGIEDVVAFAPRTSRRESLEAMVSASALLLLQPGHALSVPAKTYEYMAARRPILAVADAGETARVINESGAGIVAASDDVAAIEAALLTVIDLAARDYPGAARPFFDGAARASELADLIASVVHLDAAPAGVPATPPAGGERRA